MNGLRGLSLSITNITDEGLIHPKGMESLQDLMFWGCKGITGAGLRHLQGLTSWRVVHLANSRITDDGLAHLANTSLWRVLLGDRAVSDAGLIHLKELDSRNHINVENTRVTARGVTDFRRAMPNCEIVF